jgi:hypothetical protein
MKIIDIIQSTNLMPELPTQYKKQNLEEQVYFFTITHQEQQSWLIRRTYKEFENLNKKLTKKYKSNLKLPQLPSHPIILETLEKYLQALL